MIKIGTGSTFDTDAIEASNSTLVIVSFHGSMSPTSESLRDTLSELHDSLGTFDLVTVDVTKYPGIAFSYLATGLPRTIFLKNQEQCRAMLEEVKTTEELTVIINELI